MFRIETVHAPCAKRKSWAADRMPEHAWCAMPDRASTARTVRLPQARPGAYSLQIVISAGSGWFPEEALDAFVILAPELEASPAAVGDGPDDSTNLNKVAVKAKCRRGHPGERAAVRCTVLAGRTHDEQGAFG